jgi:hypothetical protein
VNSHFPDEWRSIPIIMNHFAPLSLSAYQSPMMQQAGSSKGITHWDFAFPHRENSIALHLRPPLKSILDFQSDCLF